MQQTNGHAHEGPTQTHYLFVFGALALLTSVTVVLSQFKDTTASIAQLCGLAPHTLGTFIALCIAAVKAMLVVSIFMHMKFEKRFMWGLVIFPLILAFIFMVGIAPDVAFHKVPPSAVKLP